MKNVILYSLIVLCFSLAANAQQIARHCPGSSSTATVAISRSGAIIASPCTGQPVAISGTTVINGTTIPANRTLLTTNSVTSPVTSGTYTPTLTGSVNISGTPTIDGNSRYLRVGNVCFVAGGFAAAATTLNTTSTLFISLPVPMATPLFATNASGAAMNADLGPAYIDAVSNSGGLAQVTFKNSAAGARTFRYSFAYDCQ